METKRKKELTGEAKRVMTKGGDEGDILYVRRHCWLLRHRTECMVTERAAAVQNAVSRLLMSRVGRKKHQTPQDFFFFF